MSREKTWKTLHAAVSVDERMGGSTRAPLNVCKYLRDQHQDASIVATTAPDDELGYLDYEYPSVPIRLFPRRMPRHNFRSPSLRRWLRDHVADYDLVEIHGIFSFVPLYTAWACRRSGTPYLVRPHGQLTPQDLKKHVWAKRLYGRLVVRPMLRGAERVLLATRQESEQLETYSTSCSREIAPLPVDPLQGTGQGSSFRTRHGIPVDAQVVLFLGRMDRAKGLQFIVPSLAALHARHPRLWFLLVGTGEPEDVAFIDSLLRDYGIIEWTTRTGFLSGIEKLSAFCASDIFVLPSLMENFGLVVVEAMQAGVPVLVSDQVFTHEIPVREGAGRSCHPDPESCRQTLDAMLTDEHGLQEMKRRAPEVAERYFSAAASTDYLLRIYAEVLDRSDPVLYFASASNADRKAEG